MEPMPEAAGLQDLLLRLDGKIKALGRLRGNEVEAERHLLLDAVAMLKKQAATNQDFNRRVQALEAKDGHNRLVAKLRSDAHFSNNWAISSFHRMMSSHNEIKIIYDQIRRVRDDGCDDYGYHSVMDSRVDGGPSEPGQVWANKFISRKGGCISTRPAEVIVEIVDELVLLRGQKQLREGHAEAARVLEERGGPGLHPRIAEMRENAAKRADKTWDWSFSWTSWRFGVNRDLAVADFYHFGPICYMRYKDLTL